MEKRQLILNDYETAKSGLWTLASCKITKAAQVQTFVSVPGRYTPLDLSTALTDGQPYYGSASLEAVLESSEGTRGERQERIGHMVNLLDGYTVRIVHPDHPSSYMVGRVQITQNYNDLVHCSVNVKAVCEPWLYNMAETVEEVQLTAGAAQEIVLANNGRLSVTPRIEASAETTVIVFTVNGTQTHVLSAGSHYLPDLYLTPGEHRVVCSGSGTVTFSYREAVLAE